MALQNLILGRKYTLQVIMDRVQHEHLVREFDDLHTGEKGSIPEHGAGVLDLFLRHGRVRRATPRFAGTAGRSDVPRRVSQTRPRSKRHREHDDGVDNAAGDTVDYHENVDEIE